MKRSHPPFAKRALLCVFPQTRRPCPHFEPSGNHASRHRFCSSVFPLQKCDDQLRPVKRTFSLAFLRCLPCGRNLSGIRKTFPMKTNRRSLIKSVAATSLVAAGIANPSPSQAQVPEKRQTLGSASRTDASSSPSRAGPSIKCQLLN